jgi:Secretion system C-terminal sorting domain
VNLYYFRLNDLSMKIVFRHITLFLILAALFGFKNDTLLFQGDRIFVSHLYPNPAADYALVDYQFSTNNQEVKIAIYNVLGLLVKEVELDREDRSAKISLKELNSGLYMYQLLVDGKPVATKKLMVRKQ